MTAEYETAGAAAFELPPEEIRAETREPMELFEEFYEKQNGKKMSEEQREYMKQMAETVFAEEQA